MTLRTMQGVDPLRRISMAASSGVIHNIPTLPTHLLGPRRIP